MKRLLEKIKNWRNFLKFFFQHLFYRYKNRITRKMIRSKINHPKCRCGYVFNVSWPVISRSMTCPKCGRFYWYERDLKMNFTFERLGRFGGKKKYEKELEEYGRINSI